MWSRGAFRCDVVPAFSGGDPNPMFRRIYGTAWSPRKRG